MKITFLGTGTSMGVPIIGCSCDVCRSINSKDKRLRASVLVEVENTAILIDCGPDFRQQMLRYHPKKLDAILITHAHKDHINGLDDIRPFNWMQSEKLQVYANDIALKEIKTAYSYAFEPHPFSGLPEMNLNTIDKKSFKIKNTDILPIEVLHYKLPVLGFRIKNFAYLTDIKTVSNEEKEKLKNLDVLVVNALRKEEHLTHFTLQEALNLIAEVCPSKAYLTHISHDMGLHSEINKELPSNVELAYDMLQIEI